MIKKIAYWLCSAIIFCLLSLLLYNSILSKNPHHDIDSKAYLEHALHFAQTSKFSAREQPYYALGYSLFIGFLYKLFRQSTITILIAQIIIALLSCWLIMHCAYKFFGNHAAFISAILFCCNLGYLVFTQFILTDLLLSFFLLLFYERLLHQHYTTAGLALGCSIIIKPAALYFVFPVIIIIMCIDNSTLLHRFYRASIFTLFFYIPIIGYMTHNKAVFGSFSVGTLSSINLYDWFLPNFFAHQHGIHSHEARTILRAHFNDDYTGSKRMHFLKKMIQSKPYSAAYVWLFNVTKTVAGLYTTNLKVLIEDNIKGGDVSFFKMPGTFIKKIWLYITTGAHRPWVIAIGIAEALWSIIRYIACILATVWLYKQKKWSILALSFVYVSYFFGITGHDGCARFRMMNEGILLILAAGGIATLTKKDRL